MGLADIKNQLGSNRSTFGTSAVLNDGNLRIEEGIAPQRIAIVGTCSNTATDSDGDYLIPDNTPYRLVTLRDLQYFKNGDINSTPSEILMQFEDAYNAGGRSFEFVITSRTVAQLGGDISSSDTIIPVDTVYTGRVSVTDSMGAHPTQNTNCAVFAHNGDVFFAGGERPDTPSAGDLTVAAKATWSTGEYILYTHTDGTVHAFWVDITGSDTEPAAVTAAVAAGTYGSTSTSFDVSGDTSADDVADTLAVAIAGSDLPFTPYRDGGAGVVDIESDEADGDGDLWTQDVSAAATGVTADTTPAGGSTTNSISLRVHYYDPATDAWAHVVDAAGIPQRLVTAVRDAGVAPETTSLYHITGGMTTIKGGADTATDNVDEITFASATSSVVTGIAAGTALTGTATTLGEATWVDAGGTTYVFGGQTGSGTLIDTVATYNPASGVLSDTTLDLNAATRWGGAYYNSGEGYIYFFGGLTATAALSETVILDTTGPSWVAETAGDLFEPMYDFAYAGVNGSGWAIGGTDGTNDLGRVQRFDPDSRTWQVRLTLSSTDAGGRMAVASNHLIYADGVQGFDFNIGLGNTADSAVGFPSSYPFYIQIDWEIMSVTGVTTVRSRGRDTDAFIVTRGQRGSTAIAHIDYADVVEDPVALYSDLDATFEVMTNNSRGDYVLMPQRAVADCPYLPQGSNFAYLLADYCQVKTEWDRGVMGLIGVFPPNEDPTKLPTIAEETAWINHLLNFDRTNYNSQEIWKIGDGVTDSDGDGKPDNYAFFSTDDSTIPTGTPPMDSGQVRLDEEGVAIDIGKHLFVIYDHGLASGQNVTAKYPNAPRGIMRNGSAVYAGTLTTLESSDGSTNMAVRGYTPYKLFSLVQQNQLNAKRYLGIVDRGANGLRWNTGYTFAWNVDEFHRSDYVLGSTFRKSVHALRMIRSVLDRYYGKPVNGQHLNALQVDIAEIIKELVDIGVVGPRTDFEFRVSRADKILGRGTLVLSIEFEGELTQVKAVITQKAF